LGLNEAAGAALNLLLEWGANNLLLSAGGASTNRVVRLDQQ
jgi:hypothetical protein